MTGGWGQWLYDGEEEQNYCRNANAVPVKVVILAGSLNGHLTQQILRENKIFQEQEYKEEKEEAAVREHMRLLSGSPGNQYISSALIPFCGSPALAHLIGMCGSVERLCPPEQHVYMVVPECAMQAHLDASAGWLPPSQVVGAPAGCESAAQQLQLAVEHFHLSSTVIVLDSSLLFFPDYNFQRIVQHSMVRAKDVCGFVRVVDGKHITEPDTRLPRLEVEDGSEHVARVTKVMPCPPLSCGSNILPLPMLVLRPTSLGLVKEFNTSSAAKATSFVDLLAFLSSKSDLFGIDLEFGPFQTSTLNQLKFTEAFFNFYPAQKEFYPVRYQCKDTMSSLKFNHEGEEETKMAMTSASQPSHFIQNSSGVPQRLVLKIQGFIDAYFEERDNPFAGVSRVQHKLPGSFYMTSYRRQVAHADTGRTYPDAM